MSEPLTTACGKYWSTCEVCLALLEQHDEILRAILEAVCERDGVDMESSFEPGKPARNFELAVRLGISERIGWGKDGCQAGKS